MSVRLNRRGATIPLTIIVIAVMAVAVAITYHRLSAERSITGDAQAQVDAFAVAQSGLNGFLAGLGTVMPPGLHDTLITGLSGGAARVILRRLKDSVMTTSLIPAVYVITSRGVNATAKRYGPRTPPVGIAVPQTAIGNGNKTFQYDSCNLTRALGSVGSIQRIRNGWTDTWSSY